MSHLHFPDGVLPIWLWASGFVLTFLFLFIFFRGFDLRKNFTRLPLLGLFSAVMFLAMSFELVPIAYHINLSVVAGILLGPALGFLAIFIVNTFSAFLGHGGITVIGLNTITMGFEAIAGYYIFLLLRKTLHNYFPLTFVTTFVTLFLSTLFTLGVVYLGTQNLGELLHAGDGGIISLELGTPKGVQKEIVPTVDFRKFITLALPLGFIGWALESTISGFLLSYLARAKPDILPSNKK